MNGALDLGGGSAEISFLYQEDAIPAKESFNVTLYGINYSLYSHSYLCYGANEARRRLLGHLVEVFIKISFGIKNYREYYLL